MLVSFSFQAKFWYLKFFPMSESHALLWQNLFSFFITTKFGLLACVGWSVWISNSQSIFVLFYIYYLERRLAWAHITFSTWSNVSITISVVFPAVVYSNQMSGRHHRYTGIQSFLSMFSVLGFQNHRKNNHVVRGFQGK